MEGQLCYDISVPENDFSAIKDEDFSKYIKNELFDVIDVKKYEYLYKVQHNKEKSKIILNKIKLDDLYFEFKYKEEEFIKNKEKIASKCKDIDIININWEEIFRRVDNDERE